MSVPNSARASTAAGAGGEEEGGECGLQQMECERAERANHGDERTTAGG